MGNSRRRNRGIAKVVRALTLVDDNARAREAIPIAMETMTVQNKTEELHSFRAIGFQLGDGAERLVLVGVKGSRRGIRSARLTVIGCPKCMVKS
jgi:hypothetical protein